MCLSFLKPVRQTDQVNSDTLKGTLFEGFVLPPSPGGPDEDAELLGVALTDEFRSIVEACLREVPPPSSEQDKAEIEKAIIDLMALVPSGKPSADYTARDDKAAAADVARWRARSLSAPVLSEALMKWRHWKPGRIKALEPASQRDIEVQLRHKWADRILSYLLPHADLVSNMAVILADAPPSVATGALGPEAPGGVSLRSGKGLVRENDKKEFLALMGDVRFRTLRNHCLCYEQLRRLGFVTIPWKEGDVRGLLNSLREAEVTPRKIQRVWDTLKWFSRKFGLLAVDEVARLSEKRKYIQEELVNTVTQPQRKAPVPDKSVIWALEEGAACVPIVSSSGTVAPSPPVLDSYILGVVRFQVGCSARFSDLQHTRPGEFKVTTNTVELQAWQTKTTSAVSIKKNPVPLICPKYSFTGVEWWDGLVSTWRKLAKMEVFKDIDFIIPTISKDYQGLIPRPGAPERSLKWLKEALVRRGVSQDRVQPLTWHSFRVFMPDCAFQLQIPRDQRQYLGNWMSESTADVYTREKRMVVCSIWEKVASKLSEINLDGARMVREDLRHADWDGDDIPVAGKASSARKGAASGSLPQLASFPPVPPGLDKPTKAPRQKFQEALAKSWGKPPKQEALEAGLRIVHATKATGPDKQWRVHLLDGEGKAVGCGWHPIAAKVAPLDCQDYIRESSRFPLCDRCFKLFRLPDNWAVVPEATQGEASSLSSDSSGSLTDDSVDTASENEKITPMMLDKNLSTPSAEDQTEALPSF